VDVCANCALVGRTARLFGSGGHPALAQHNKGVFHIALGFLQCLEAVAHRGTGFFAQFLYELGIDLYSFGGGHNFLLASIEAA
jgi:hypothetical protein